MTSEVRRCYLCKLDLPIARFRRTTNTTKRGGKVWKQAALSSDCRDCNREYKRAQRRRRAEREGRRYTRRAEKSATRLVAEASAARAAERASLRWRPCTPQQNQERLEKNQRATASQRERYHSDPTFYARVKAKKLQRKHALIATQVERVDREAVAERDGWVCSICGGEVTRATWSMDHVVPLAKGGPHTYANVALAHLVCNIAKGDRL
jgi:5-methylcytosine-specific restriction endonuclease McrA